MHLKGLFLHFQEMVIVYYAMAYIFGDITVQNQTILLNFCWVSIFLDILNANI